MLQPFRTTIILALSAMLLSGCLYRSEPAAVDEPDEVLEQIENLREALANHEGTDTLEEVQMPLAESWLEHPLNARYRALPAVNAFRLVTQGHPVRFNFDEADSPEVIFPPKAGTIREHLDSIAAQADWSYSVEKGVVQVRNMETRQFILNAQPGSSTSAINLRGLKDAGGAENNNSVQLGLDPYANEVLAAVRNVLGESGDGASPSGSQAALAPSANMLIVTARPNTMREVEKLIGAYNNSISKIVRIEMSLIEVAFDNSDSRDLLMNLIRRSNDLPIGLLISSTGTGSSVSVGDSSLLSVNRIADASLIEGQSRYDGSSAVFSWLSAFGDATVNYDDTIEVLNNHVASVDVTRTEQYVSSITLQAVSEEGGVAVPEVEFAELRTGTVVHVQPTIVGERITVRIGLSRSVPIERSPYNFAGVSGTNFTTSDFNRLLAVSLTDGEPKLLASLSSSSTRERKTGIPLFSSFGIGTSKKDEVSRRETVMLITATILNS